MGIDGEIIIAEGFKLFSHEFEELFTKKMQKIISFADGGHEDYEDQIIFGHCYSHSEFYLIATHFITNVDLGRYPPDEDKLIIHQKEVYKKFKVMEIKIIEEKIDLLYLIAKESSEKDDWDLWEELNKLVKLYVYTKCIGKFSDRLYTWCLIRAC